MKIGDKFTLTSDAVENYGSEYANKVFTVSHIAYDKSQHPGYDEGLNGQALYDAEELQFSVYDYEVEPE